MEIPNKLFVGGHFFSFFMACSLLDFKEVGGTCCRPNPLLCRVGNSGSDTVVLLYLVPSLQEMKKIKMILFFNDFHVCFYSEILLNMCHLVFALMLQSIIIAFMFIVSLATTYS